MAARARATGAMRVCLDRTMAGRGGEVLKLQSDELCEFWFCYVLAMAARTSQLKRLRHIDHTESYRELKQLLSRN